MKNKFIILYTIFISCIYAFALSFFGYNMFKEFNIAKEYPEYIPNSLIISNSFKVAFLMILAATILTFIVIIFTKDDDQDNNENEPEDNNAEPDNIENNLESLEVTPSVEENDVQKPEIEKPEIVENNNDDNQKNHESDSTSKLPSEEFNPIPINPEGLFSPITGFGWESYLLTRLDGELKRAISSEFDLALFIICLPEIERESAIIQEICNYLTVQFQFKDLIFEYQNDCFVTIKTNMNLDDALTLADKLHFEINNILEKIEKKCYIGISTRTIRIISGERLLNEAYEALKHAKEDEENPIIAFRANAEKYLKLIQKQNEM